MASPGPNLMKIDRRAVLKSGVCMAGCLAAADLVAAQLPPIPIIDTHIHLFDPTRPGGVPWPEPSDTVLYKPALPNRYQQLSRNLGIVGAIAIEASPVLRDNDWLLDIAKENPLIVGIVGDLVPGPADFTGQLDRLHRNPLFLGLRYGNLWNRNLAEDVHRPGFMDGLKLLSQRKLVFESANPNLALIRTLATIAETIPDLTIVIDHLPHAEPPASPAEKSEYIQTLQTLGKAPRVFVKLSEIPVNKGGNISPDLSTYKDILDELWNIFGEDKTLFGSDWPNSDHQLPFAETVGILKTYASSKGRLAQQKLFWRNSVHAYQWHPRLPSQMS